MDELLFNIRNVLIVRMKQTYRMVYMLGVVRLIILFILLISLITTVYLNTTQIWKAYSMVCIWLILVIFIHLRRRDRIFFYINISFYRLIICVEYVLLSLPLFICLLFNKQWIAMIFSILGIIGISFIEMVWKRQNKTLNTCLQRYIPSDMYEWKAGIRKYLFLIIPTWIIGLCFSFFLLSIPIALFVIGLLVFDFYQINESWQILLSYRKSANKLLYHKIERHVLIFSIITFPLIVVFFIFHFEFWYILFIEFIVLLSIHIYCIVLKYAFYSHNAESVNPVLQMTGIFVGAIPPATPILWILSIFFFYKAKMNLYFYLYYAR